MTEIKFCDNNFSQGIEDIVNKLKDEGLNVEVEPCLGYCGDCAVGPFALVNDELIQSATPDELYSKIKSLI